MKKITTMQLLETSFREQLKGLSTAIVGHILAFDSATQRAHVQVGVQQVTIDNARMDIAPIIDVPVVFMGGIAHMEFEVNPNDEGLLVFMHRNIDGWKQTGGIGVNPTARIMQMQDCIFIHGCRSLAQAIQGFENNGIRLRHNDNHVWLKNDGTIILKNEKITHTYNNDGSLSIGNGAGLITMDTSGTVTINGMTIPANSGEATYSGVIKANDMQTNGGISLQSHTHGGVQTGGADTGVPK